MLLRCITVKRKEIKREELLLDYLKTNHKCHKTSDSLCSSNSDCSDILHLLHKQRRAYHFHNRLYMTLQFTNI